MSFKALLFLVSWLVGTECVMTGMRCDYGSQWCTSNQICCGHQCVYDSDCYGRTCSSYSSYDQCSGISCCDGICQYSCDDYVIPLIVGITAGVCFLIFVVGIVVCCICRKRRAIPQGGYIIAQPHTVTTAANFNQATTGQLYYQQGYGQANPQYGYGAI